MLTQYLSAMGRFHNHSFGNIMLIARQRAVTWCYTSLESINTRVSALRKSINGQPQILMRHSGFLVVPIHGSLSLIGRAAVVFSTNKIAS